MPQPALIPERNFPMSSTSKSRIAIIGSGPSGYTAAIYTGRAQLSPTVYTGPETGGQLMYTTELENFPGFPEGVKGPQFMMSLQKQAEKFGTKIEHKFITAVDFSQRPFKLWTQLPEDVDMMQYKRLNRDEKVKIAHQVKESFSHDSEADVVLVATGAVSRRLNIPGEDKFFGKGVSTCAVCDAAFYREKKVYVIGGGDTAMEDALALTKFTNDVNVIHRRDQFRASKVMQERVLNHEHINVLWNSSLKEVRGSQTVEQIIVETDGEAKELPADGVFLAIGHQPVTAIFQDQIELDQSGYVVTGLSLSAKGVETAQQRLENDKVTWPTMTSVPGVFAAGDVVDVRYWQAITAAGMGAAAALDLERWVEENL